MIKIDLKDRKILSELDMNARIPMTELARKTKLSRQVVEYRLQRLGQEKVIFGALTIVDSGVLGYGWYRVLLRLLKVTSLQKNQFIDYLKTNKNITWLGEVGGNWDIVANFACKDHHEFNVLFEEICSKFGQFIMHHEVLTYVNIYDYPRTYFLNNSHNYNNNSPQNNSNRPSFFHAMIKNEHFSLDGLDKNILQQMSVHAFTSTVELGNRLKVSRNTIKNRLDELEKKKVILGYRIIINPSSLGYHSHLLFLGINQLDLQREKQLYSFLSSIPQITFVVKHIGKWRMGMEIETKDEIEFQNIFVEIRGKFSDIISDYESFPVFKDHVINYFPGGILK